MPKKWGWFLSHTLNSKNYVLYENGQITSAMLANSGERLLHISGFGIKFEWQRGTGHWWSEKCSILLKPKEEAELPSVRFSIPIDLEPGSYKYKVGVRTAEDKGISEGWKEHGIVWGEKEHEVEIARPSNRDYQVFISHSNHPEDKQMIKMLSTLLFNNGIRCFIAEEIPKYGEILWKKIKRGIITADRVLILWTKHAAKSEDVREELGITVGAGKRFVPIIEKKVKLKGSLIGTEYIRVDREKFKDVFVNMTEELIKFSIEKAKRAKKIKPEEELPS